MMFGAVQLCFFSFQGCETLVYKVHQLSLMNVHSFKIICFMQNDIKTNVR